MKISEKIEEFKFNKHWYNRNIDNADIIIESLELNPIVIDQYLMIEETPEITDKLKRIGFTSLHKYPNSTHFDKYFYVLYNTKYNVAFSVYKTSIKAKIKTSYDIAYNLPFSDDYKISVFLSAIKVLYNDK